MTDLAPPAGRPVPDAAQGRRGGPGTGVVRAVAVVVPAHDEAALLGRCLEGILAATVPPGVALHVVVALDSCTDATADVAAEVARAHPQVQLVALQARSVGAAREAGTARALALALAGWGPGQVWVASTDADSLVPPDWLTHQVALADAGADLVLGLVDLDDHARAGADADARTREVWRRRYRSGLGTGEHVHVHGANLGVRASVLAAVGGWRDTPAHEDHALVAAARAAGAAVVTTTAATVRTSPRLSGRAPVGVAADLTDLADLAHLAELTDLAGLTAT